MISHSGKFVLRIPQVMHRQLAELARRSKISLNQACVELLKDSLYGGGGEPPLLKQLNEVAQKLRKNFGEKLCGVVLFGSQATGNATRESDIDLLIVLNSSEPVERSLYRWWDDNIKWSGENMLNPHFVNLPSEAKSAGGLWLEVATTGKIIYQKNSMLDKLFGELRELISQGLVRMYTSNGHSYWKWR